MSESVADREELCEYFYESGLNFLPSVAERHIQEMMTAMVQKGHSGKMQDCGELGIRHRTTYGYFLSKGKWDEKRVEAIQQQKSFQTIASMSKECNQPLYLSIDDTVVSRKKSSGRAVHPMEVWAGTALIRKAKRYTDIKCTQQSSARERIPCATVCIAIVRNTEQK